MPFVASCRKLSFTLRTVSIDLHNFSSSAIEISSGDSSSRSSNHHNLPSQEMTGFINALLVRFPVVFQNFQVIRFGRLFHGVKVPMPSTI